MYGAILGRHSGHGVKIQYTTSSRFTLIRVGGINPMENANEAKLTIAYLYLATYNEESYQEQRDGIEKAAATNGHTIDTWVQDGGGSRHGYSRLIEQVHAGEIQRIYVTHLGRFTRSIREEVRLLEILDQHDVEVISVQGGPQDKLTRVLRLVFAKDRLKIEEARLEDRKKSKQ
jgi:DNA invertase Pin-like site-specific DNA recombinase